ncbi:coagulation factor X-like [Glandiceps talaboti]
MNSMVAIFLLSVGLQLLTSKVVFGDHAEHVEVIREAEPCWPNPCQNGAECFQNWEILDYICECTAGYSGKNCDEQCDISTHHGILITVNDDLRYMEANIII